MRFSPPWPASLSAPARPSPMSRPSTSLALTSLEKRTSRPSRFGWITVAYEKQRPIASLRPATSER